MSDELFDIIAADLSKNWRIQHVIQIMGVYFIILFLDGDMFQRMMLDDVCISLNLFKFTCSC